MLVEFEFDGQKSEPHRVAINPDHVIMVEEVFRSGTWGGAITNVHLTNAQTLIVRGTYDVTVLMLKGGHVSDRAVAT